MAHYSSIDTLQLGSLPIYYCWWKIYLVESDEEEGFLINHRVEGGKGRREGTHTLDGQFHVLAGRHNSSEVHIEEISVENSLDDSSQNGDRIEEVLLVVSAINGLTIEIKRFQPFFKLIIKIRCTLLVLKETGELISEGLLNLHVLFIGFFNSNILECIFLTINMI